VSHIYPTDSGKKHAADLSKLAATDPEFYKYLQENDKELLDFNPEDDDGVDDSEDEAGTSKGNATVLTKDMLNKWQKSILEVRQSHCILYH
jgi:nucleolar complex protein 2